MTKTTVTRRQRWLPAGVLLCTLAGGGCGDGGGTPTVEKPRAAGLVEVVSGAGQEAEVGTELAQPLVVLVKDEAGHPLQGATVEWFSALGRGVAGTPFSTTDAAGRAQARWTLGTRPGADSVVARVRGSTVETRIVVRALTGAAARLVTNPAEISIPYFNAGREVTADLTDRYGNVIAGAVVSWTSLDAQLARVEPSGTGARVVPVSPGRARIEARSGPFLDTLKVEVTHTVVRVQVTPYRLRAVVGDSILFSAVGLDQGNALMTAPVSWSVTGQAIALQPAGSAHAVGRVQAPGTVVVKATLAWEPYLQTTVQIEAVASSSWASVEAGEIHNCGVATDGRGFCWGQNFNNSLGTDAPDSCPGVPCNTTPMPIRGGYTFASVASGSLHTCGLTTAGRALCWGGNDFGQLGNGAPTNLTVREPVEVTGGHTFVSLTLGTTHACGLDAAGRAFCWGGNQEGEVGGGSATPGNVNPVPVHIARDLTFRHLAAGEWRTCGVTTGGETYCWGRYIGNTPRRVADAPDFVQLSVGWLHICGLTATGDAYCWGMNEAGELGLGRTALFDERTPQRVNGGHRFASIAAGYRYTCGVTVDGAGYCWGSDKDGVLGNGGADTPVGTPTPVAGGHVLRSVTAGRDHACAMGVSGRAYCWGWGYVGVIGNGTRDGSSVPTPVSAI